MVWCPPPPQTSHLHIICSIWEAQPARCTLFATVESHNLVTGPSLAVHFQHINLSLAESSTYYPKPANVLPIAYLTHSLPLIASLHFTYLLPIDYTLKDVLIPG